MNVLMWFKRDLRVEDHPALALAAAKGRVLPVYIAEPGLWRQPDRSGRHWAFTAEALRDLREALERLGLPLVLRVGEAVEVLDRLARLHGISEIVSHAEAGCGWSASRNARVAGWARAAGLRWTELAPEAEAPAAAWRAVEGVEPGPIPPARALGLAEDPCPHRQQGGRSAGLVQLDAFLATRTATRPTATPAGAERGASRLSAHLAFGTLGLRELRQAAERPGLRGFRNRLALRDACLRAMPAPPEAAGDDRHLAAWLAGETGLPYLDACMRYLRATGWLDAPARAMAVGCATGLFGISPQAAGQALARRCTDYDPALHWPQVLAARPGHPLRLGLRLDPGGGFTRRWLPELAPVPEPFLHMPWRWEGAPRLLGRRYPEPLVGLPPVPPRRPPRPGPAPQHQLCLDL